jgi:hypothetical protein
MPEGIERLLENTFDRDVHISLDVKKATEIFVLGCRKPLAVTLSYHQGMPLAEGLTYIPPSHATCWGPTIPPSHATCWGPAIPPSHATPWGLPYHQAMPLAGGLPLRQGLTELQQVATLQLLVDMSRQLVQLRILS